MDDQYAIEKFRIAVSVFHISVGYTDWLSIISGCGGIEIDLCFRLHFGRIL